MASVKLRVATLRYVPHEYFHKPGKTTYAGLLRVKEQFVKPGMIVILNSISLEGVLTPDY